MRDCTVNGALATKIVNPNPTVGSKTAGYTFLGHGVCRGENRQFYDYLRYRLEPISDYQCGLICNGVAWNYVKIENVGITTRYNYNSNDDPYNCWCLFKNGDLDNYSGVGGGEKNTLNTATSDNVVANPGSQNSQNYNCYTKKEPTRAPTKSPSKTPTKTPTNTPTATSAGAQGDPHFKTWSKKMFDFHGVCDLMMLSNEKFENNLGMDIHIRTKKMRMWSYISALVIRMGKDILEVVGKHGGSYIVNGILNQRNSDGVLTLSGYPINYTRKSSKQQMFRLYLSALEAIVIETWNSFVSVHFENPKIEHFKDSRGIMGSFPDGTWLARDKVTIFNDANLFGQEWQVLEPEAKLFREVKGPQQPLEKCEIPSNLNMRRRLSDRTMTQNEAERACLDVKVDNVDICVFDVMATNDIVTAESY